MFKDVEFSVVLIKDRKKDFQKAIALFNNLHNLAYIKYYHIYVNKISSHEY